MRSCLTRRAIPRSLLTILISSSLSATLMPTLTQQLRVMASEQISWLTILWLSRRCTTFGRDPACSIPQAHPTLAKVRKPRRTKRPTKKRRRSKSRSTKRLQDRNGKMSGTRDLKTKKNCQIKSAQSRKMPRTRSCRDWRQQMKNRKSWEPRLRRRNSDWLMSNRRLRRQRRQLLLKPKKVLKRSVKKRRTKLLLRKRKKCTKRLRKRR